jgi:hypothetical protein
MGFGESDSSVGHVNAMIARLRKATTAWTARFHQSYSESVREQDAEQASTGDEGASNEGRSRIHGASVNPDIPDLELLRCIGRGSYGEVWLAPKHSGHLPSG